MRTLPSLYRALVISIAFWGSFALSCQTVVDYPLGHAEEIVQQGQFTKAIEEIPQIISQSHLSNPQLGRALVLLGFAYQEEGEFMQARQAYERALPLLLDHQAPSNAYAAGLESLADLYQDMGNLKAAIKLDRDALAIYRRTQQHASVARSCRNLAVLELSEGDRKKGSKYLTDAIEEAKNAEGLDEDFFAAVSSTQGWLAKLSGDIPTEVASYQRAVDLWTQKHGEESMLTGWGYLLLGDAKFRIGERTIALEDIRRGLGILARTIGPESPKYISGEIAYAHALDQTGAHEEAARLKHTAEEKLAELYHKQCVNCAISAAVLH